MKMVIAGGTGQVGSMLTRAYARAGHTCVVLTRQPDAPSAKRIPAVTVRWDGRTLGAWARELEGADVVINLAGRSVNCRYHEANLAAMERSRVDSARVLGEAIAMARTPPRVWLQASTATIYAHRYDAANDEVNGRIGGDEPGVPALWKRSVEIAQAWEEALMAERLPRTRRVALRSAMIMSPDRGGVFDVWASLCRLGLGRHGNGNQYVSWIHEYDFVAALDWLVAREEIAGVVNLCSPRPLPNREFVAGLQRALGRRWTLPVSRWALEVGAVLRRTETELLLKSRRVVPTRLLESGFRFRHPDWPEAARELVSRWRR